MSEPRPFYDPKRPEAIGRWVVVVKQGSLSILRSFHTQCDANRLVGLPGGSTDPRYVPEV